MACESCRPQTTRSLLRAASRASSSFSRPVIHARRSLSSQPRSASSCASSSQPTPITTLLPTTTTSTRVQARWFSSTPTRSLLGLGSLGDAYRVLGGTEALYKVCGRVADYSIAEEARKNDQVIKMPDGEELGIPIDENNVWHKTFGLQPSFSTWSHVTMLHLYLLNARVRCFPRDDYRTWQQQLIDHFFFDCERKMHIDHNITSSALRQRYLKDVFVQWRGLLLAYDEGLVKGDAILASALWRNLFKGSPDVDPRALCAVVGWMRSCLYELEGVPDHQFAEAAVEIVTKPVEGFWSRLEGPFSKMAEKESGVQGVEGAVE
ncbi:hypothetical protein E4U15_004930 [Claviceps sp. LM218 group G6]|nr:hypothetical protein E4U15_004930 [Claviceps sp. LM218 group G6]